MTRENQQMYNRRKRIFLKALAETGSVSRAAKIAGVSLRRPAEWRSVDPAFAQEWEDAMEQAADKLEAEAWRRAVEGVDEPVVSMGQIVRNQDGSMLTMRRYSDQLLTMLLRGAKPDKYGPQSLQATPLENLGIMMVLEKMAHDPELAGRAAHYVGLIDAPGTVESDAGGPGEDSRTG
jgi:hypothetical protein